MPELVKLYKNLQDKGLQHMLYKTKTGLLSESFGLLDAEDVEIVFAIKNGEDYFVIRGGYYSEHSIGE